MNLDNQLIIEDSAFYLLDQAELIVRKQSSTSFQLELFEELINIGIVTTVFKGDFKYLWCDDVNLCIRLMKLNADISFKLTGVAETEYANSLLVKRIALSENTYLLYDSIRKLKPIPAFIKNILFMHGMYDYKTFDEHAFYELLDYTIVSNSRRVCDYLESALYRKLLLQKSRKSVFAYTSPIPGTKTTHINLIIEAIIPHLSDDVCFLDLMCGSGSVSRALTRLGNVYSSDSQQFCKLMTMAQGAGINKKRAIELLEIIKEDYTRNLQTLSRELADYVEKENDIFHMDLGNTERIYDEYKYFCDSFSLYSSTGECSEAIRTCIDYRKKDKTRFPYCLFTYYFSNVFYGLSQSMQIDSIRYAVDQIKDIKEKNWALGVLVIVTHFISTTSNGHYAQPMLLRKETIESVINKRSTSVWLEFSRRMIEMAFEGEKCNYHISLIDGPWQNALRLIKKRRECQWIVYLDAPYNRVDYSRYYHVLETLVLYDYPSSVNKGRMPSPKGEERFKSEFLLRDKKKINIIFVSIITEILYNNSVCVWSYSNSGTASIIDVVESVKKATNCNVYIYSTPIITLAHRTRQKKKIQPIEYCIVFSMDVPNDFR